MHYMSSQERFSASLPLQKQPLRRSSANQRHHCHLSNTGKDREATGMVRMELKLKLKLNSYSRLLLPPSPSPFQSSDTSHLAIRPKRFETI
jgi:hypothetical protein